MQVSGEVVLWGGLCQVFGGGLDAEVGDVGVGKGVGVGIGCGGDFEGLGVGGGGEGEAGEGPCGLGEFGGVEALGVDEELELVLGGV